MKMSRNNKILDRLITVRIQYTIIRSFQRSKKKHQTHYWLKIMILQLGKVKIKAWML